MSAGSVAETQRPGSDGGHATLPEQPHAVIKSGRHRFWVPWCRNIVLSSLVRELEGDSGVQRCKEATVNNAADGGCGATSVTKQPQSFLVHARPAQCFLGTSSISPPLGGWKEWKGSCIDTPWRPAYPSVVPQQLTCVRRVCFADCTHMNELPASAAQHCFIPTSNWPKFAFCGFHSHLRREEFPLR